MTQRPRRRESAPRDQAGRTGRSSTVGPVTRPPVEQRFLALAASRMRYSWCAQAVLAVVLLVAALWAAPEVPWAYVPPVRLVLFLAFSGLPVALALHRTWRPMELLSIGVICSLLVWSTGFVLLRKIGLGHFTAWFPFVIAIGFAAFDF